MKNKCLKLVPWWQVYRVTFPGFTLHNCACETCVSLPGVLFLFSKVWWKKSVITRFSSWMPLKRLMPLNHHHFHHQKSFIELLQSFRYCRFQKLCNMVYMTCNRFRFLLQKQHEKSYITLQSSMYSAPNES